MPANPVIISANVSNIKIDGEVLPGLQSIEYKIEKGKVEGFLNVRSFYPKFETVLFSGVADKKSFQMVIELKKGNETIRSLVFDKCYLKSTTFSMSSDGVGTSVYEFTGTLFRQKEPSSISKGVSPIFQTGIMKQNSKKWFSKTGGEIFDRSFKTSWCESCW